MHRGPISCMFISQRFARDVDTQRVPGWPILTPIEAESRSPLCQSPPDGIPGSVFEIQYCAAHTGAAELGVI